MEESCAVKDIEQTHHGFSRISKHFCLQKDTSHIHYKISQNLKINAPLQLGLDYINKILSSDTVIMSIY